MACELIRKKIPEHKTKRDCYKAIAEELGVKWKTVETWYLRGTSNEGRTTSTEPPAYEKVEMTTAKNLEKNFES